MVSKTVISVAGYFRLVGCFVLQIHVVDPPNCGYLAQGGQAGHVLNVPQL